MKYYTDSKTVVEAEHRAGAFDKLQEIYGHSDIGDIFTAYKEESFIKGIGDWIVVHYLISGKKGMILLFDPKEIKWPKESEKW